MSTFKCKMCGGELHINPGESVAVCEYCGTTQTLPKLDDDRRVNLYDRANHFRRNNDFDKAAGIYEQILNENKTDAEAYWSLVLCRYGIEGFLQSPGTEKEPHVQVRELADFIAVEIIGQVLVFQDMVGRILIAFAQEIARSAGGESRHGDQRRQAFEERPARHARRAPLTPTPSPAAPGPAEKAGYGDDNQAGKGQETGQQPDQAGHGLAVIETFPARRDETGKEVFIMVEAGCR